MKGDSMKRSMWIVTLAVLIAAVLLAYSAIVNRAGANDDQSGGGWEDLVVQGGTGNLSPGDGGSMRKEPGSFSRESFPLERNLDKLGAKGWELVTVSGSRADTVFFFKPR